MEALRTLALITLLAAAPGSLALMFRVGRRNPSILLLGLFTIWVLSPFLALAWAGLNPKRWPAGMRTAVYSLMLIVSLASLAVYAVVAFGPPRAQPAAAFLAVPLASWLLIAILFTIVHRK